ncbi:MAG: 2-oxoacid:ferredoxin oxidoreductase subunit beta [Myxococcota bacterium]
MSAEALPKFTKKDFMSDQTIRWCPGCGDYSILSQVQTVLAEIGKPPHEVAVISGIGCSSRFPYYVNTYGFHTIHGRAPAFATGLKIANPELDVWQITGDGDALSIGGNHLLHALRRNVNMQILLFNNRIYGLTKGQYSPTSEENKITKSTPMGSLDHPVEPCRFALGSDATFVARSADIFVAHLREMLRETHKHQGCSFLEIYQNCNIFNDKAFDTFTGIKNRAAAVVYCKHGEPLIYGSKKVGFKGLKLNGQFNIEMVELEDENQTDGLLIHDETNPILANMLVNLAPPFPVAMGVIYRVKRPTYDDALHAQMNRAQNQKTGGFIGLQQALSGKQTWEVK